MTIHIERIFRWHGHVIQMVHQHIHRLALHWEVPGFKRGPSCPRANWRCKVTQALAKDGNHLGGSREMAALNGSEWLQSVTKVYPHWRGLNQGQRVTSVDELQRHNSPSITTTHHSDADEQSVVAGILTSINHKFTLPVFKFGKLHNVNASTTCNVILSTVSFKLGVFVVDRCYTRLRCRYVYHCIGLKTLIVINVAQKL